MAEVSCRMENGSVRDIVVPLKVGRMLQAHSIGLPMDEEAAFDSIHNLELKACNSVLVDMLSRRDHSVSEVHDKLACYGYRDIEIQAAIQFALDNKFLDDDRFSRVFIESRLRRGWGRRKIEIELRRLGIEPSDIPGYPEDFNDNGDDLERAVALLRRRTIPESRAREKFLRFLVGRGFDFSIAREAVDAVLDDGR